MVTERSLGNLLLVLLAAGAIAGSLALPWWSYEHTTGRRAPEGGFHDPDEDGVIRTQWGTSLRGSNGEAAPDDAQGTQAVLDRVRWTLVATMAILGLSALSELPGIARILIRPVTLVLNCLAFAGVATALAWMWFQLPPAFGHGATSPFTSFLDDTGYTMTTLRAGWIVAAFAAPAIFGGFLLKYQAGAPDPTVVAELYAQGEI